MAAELFKGQDFRLTLLSGIDLTGWSVLRILYVSPSGICGFWPGLQDVQSVYHDVLSTENNEAGQWKYQLYVEISGKTYFGTVVSKTILDEILC